MKFTTADSLKVREDVEIVGLDEREATGLRLAEMGFSPGKRLQLLISAPFGDPLAFRIDNTIVALRKDEARLIRVKPVNSAA